MLSKNIKKNKGDKGKSAYKSGYFAETLACLMLMLKGYNIIHRNTKGLRGTKYGEIDIIATKHKTLIFIEVKKRKNFILSSESISLKNKKRVSNTAEYFLGQNSNFNDFDVRFDAILFDKYFIPKHIKDAWRPNWW